MLVVVLRTIVIQFYGALDGPDSDLSICVWHLLRKLLIWSYGWPKLRVVNFLKVLWRAHRYKRNFHSNHAQAQTCEFPAGFY